MTDPPSRPRKLARHNDVAGFRSGASELDDWLRRYAWENLRANNAITYVSVVGDRVVGYYAIASGAVDLTAAPSALKKGPRPDPLPVIVLARLAVDVSMASRGIGAGLLRDALERAAHLSDSIGAAALLVHARDTTARDFYLHNGDFLPSPIDDLQLLAPMKELRSLFLT
ncbi:MAG: GNAT family N-acetyltransferase [Micrococcales bacterium]|nr:GNAT family N-acetyltransferase [Micrococcales bacterium]